MSNEKPNPFKSAASAYLRRGWSPIALPSGRKSPPPTGWTGYLGDRIAENRVPKSWLERPHNVGLRLPQTVIGIDVDDYDEKRGGETFAAAVERLGPLPVTWRSSSREDDPTSGIRYFTVPAGVTWAGVLGPDVEVVSWHERYAVVSPSIHPEGRQYRWFCPCGELPADCFVDHGNAPTVGLLPALPEAWVAELRVGDAADRSAKADLSNSDAGEWLAGLGDGEPCSAVEAALDDLREALGEGSRHDAARDGLMKLIRLGEQGHAGLPAAIEAAEEAWLEAFSAGDREPGEGEWERLVVGGVAMALGSPTAEDDRGCCGPRVKPVGSLPRPSATLAAKAQRAGDAFNDDDSAGTFLELLQTHGWTVSGEDGGKVYLRRGGKPEKDKDHSATLTRGRLKIHQRKDAGVAPLEEGKTYTKFSAYAALSHGGDWKAAAKELHGRGYGQGAGLDLVDPDHPNATMWNAERLMEVWTWARGCYALRAPGDGGFIEYVGTHYVPRSRGQVRAILNRRLKAATYEHPDRGAVPFPATPPLVGVYLSQVEMDVHLSEKMYESGFDYDTWDICNEDACVGVDQTARYMSMRNGLLKVRTGEMRPHNPAFITLSSSPYPFDPDAGEPEITLKVLRDQFPARASEDQSREEAEAFQADQIAAIQEYFGFLVFGSNADGFDAVIALLGQSGSGKSMWMKVIEGLVGIAHVVAVNPAGLATNFGKQEIPGKRLVVMSDANVKAGPAVSEYYKTVTNNDTVSFDRKNQGLFVGKVTAPHAIVSNGIPAFQDPSGAVAKRIKPIWFTVEFRGKEGDNSNLHNDILMTEAKELLAWLWKGYRRALDRGKLAVVHSEATDMIEDLMAAGTSPFQSWLQARCVVSENGYSGMASAGALLDSHNEWAGMADAHRLNPQTFPIALLEALPWLAPAKRRTIPNELKTPAEIEEGKQIQRSTYIGIRLLTEAELEARDGATPSGFSDLGEEE